MEKEAILSILEEHAKNVADEHNKLTDKISQERAQLEQDSQQQLLLRGAFEEVKKLIEEFQKINEPMQDAAVDKNIDITKPINNFSQLPIDET